MKNLLKEQEWQLKQKSAEVHLAFVSASIHFEKWTRTYPLEIASSISKVTYYYSLSIIKWILLTYENLIGL